MYYIPGQGDRGRWMVYTWLSVIETGFPVIGCHQRQKRKKGHETGLADLAVSIRSVGIESWFERFGMMGCLCILTLTRPEAERERRSPAARS